MVIDLNELFNKNLYKLKVSGTINIDEEYIKNTDIRKISPVKVDGYILNNEECLEIDINITGEMILPCARTLKDVKYPFDINIDELIDENSDNSLEIVQNKLDIFPIIWQNILVDVPLRILAPDANEKNISGDGWCLITENDKKEEIDPRLRALDKYKE